MTDARVSSDGIATERARRTRDPRDGLPSAISLDAWYAQNAALRAEVYAVLARQTDLHAMLQRCAESIVRHLDVAFVRVWTLPRGANTLTLKASAGDYTRLDGRHSRISVGALKIGAIARDAVAIVTNEVRTDPRIEDQEWAAREGMVAFAGVPLVVDDRVVGVMALFARRPLESETYDALELIAAAIAQGIERLRSEEELRRSEAYLAEAQRLTHTGSWALRLATGELVWSRELFRICGLATAQVPPPLQSAFELVHPDDAPRLRQRLAESVATGAEVKMRVRLVVPGKSGRPEVKRLVLYGHPVRDPTGEVTEFIGSVIDVTAQMRASRRLRRAERDRLTAVLAERTRIARDMHDGVLQDLASIALQLGAVLPHVLSSPAEAEARLRHILATTERAGHAARHALTGMRSTTDRVDLTHAVERTAHLTAASQLDDGVAADGAPLAVTVRVGGEPRLVATPVRDAAVAVVQEAVRNVRRHAAARTVTVTIAFRRRSAVIAVRDDGRGFGVVPDDGAGHWGIVGMRERAAEVGGTLTVSSLSAQGSVVRLRVPLER